MPLTKPEFVISTLKRLGVPSVKTNWNTKDEIWATGNMTMNTLSNKVLFPWKIIYILMTGSAISELPTRWNTPLVVMLRLKWPKQSGKQPHTTPLCNTRMLTKIYSIQKQSICVPVKWMAVSWKTSTLWKAGKDSKKEMPHNTPGMFPMTSKVW